MPAGEDMRRGEGGRCYDTVEEEDLVAGGDEEDTVKITELAFGSRGGAEMG